MCIKTRDASLHLPTWTVRVLAVCLLALGFHFVGESLALATTPSQLLVAAPGQSPHPGHDVTEDHFVMTAVDRLSVEPGFLWDRPAPLVEVYLIHLAPPVPPPNL
jgi:hypothetical protein